MGRFKYTINTPTGEFCEYCRYIYTGGLFFMKNGELARYGQCRVFNKELTPCPGNPQMHYKLKKCIEAGG